MQQTFFEQEFILHQKVTSACAKPRSHCDFSVILDLADHRISSSDFLTVFRKTFVGKNEVETGCDFVIVFINHDAIKKKNIHIIFRCFFNQFSHAVREYDIVRIAEENILATCPKNAVIARIRKPSVALMERLHIHIS